MKKKNVLIRCQNTAFSHRPTCGTESEAKEAKRSILIGCMSGLNYGVNLENKQKIGYC